MHLDTLPSRPFAFVWHFMRRRKGTFALLMFTLEDMDRILVFERGRIVEDGAHAVLLKNGGHYATLWNRQAGGFLPDTEEEKV